MGTVCLTVGRSAVPPPKKVSKLATFHGQPSPRRPFILPLLFRIEIVPPRERSVSQAAGSLVLERQFQALQRRRPCDRPEQPAARAPLLPPQDRHAAARAQHRVPSCCVDDPVDLHARQARSEWDQEGVKISIRPPIPGTTLDLRRGWSYRASMRCTLDHEDLKRDENWFTLAPASGGLRMRYDFPEGVEDHYYRNCPACHSTIVRTSADVTRELRPVTRRMRAVKL